MKKQRCRFSRAPRLLLRFFSFRHLILLLPCLPALASVALILYTHLDPILENARRTEYLQKLDKTFAQNPEYFSDGFDYPVGPPDARGYYCAQEFSVNRHLGEDWNGARGGNTDINDPVYAAANGVVVFADWVSAGWGNVIRIVHRVPDKKKRRWLSPCGDLVCAFKFNTGASGRPGQTRNMDRHNRKRRHQVLRASPFRITQ